MSHCKLNADVSPLNHCALNDSMCSEEIRFIITNTSNSEVMVAETRCDGSKTTTTAITIADIDTAHTNAITSSARSVGCCCGNIACNCDFVMNDSDSYSTALRSSSRSTKTKITGLLGKRFSLGIFSVSPQRRKSVSACGRYEDRASDEPKNARSTAKISVNAEKRSATTTSSVRRRLFRNSTMENWPDINSEISTKTWYLDEFSNDVKSASRIVSWLQPRVFIDADEFFEDPCAVRLHREEVAWAAEWCIVDDIDLFVERQRYRSSGPTVYQETEFCGDSNDDDTFVKVNRTPSVISLTSYVEDEYGIFHSPVSYDYVIPKIPEACYPVGFDHDIECGLPFDNQISLVSAYEKIMEETLQGASAPSTPMLCRKKLNTSAELLEEKVDALGKSLMGPLMTAVPKPIRKNTEFSVQKLFGLSDDGDICINIDHITEERGYGFMLKKSRRVYRNVEEGAEINENHLIRRPALLLLLLRRLLQSLCCYSTPYETSDTNNNKNNGEKECFFFFGSCILFQCDDLIYCRI